ncbi:RuvA C-terminal domain-containing protein [Bacillus andreraoultii]|uniref:RuvA C-terminal domain-containing protein n=1 Tax=Bacillus andreraoultii TaxID=1499685 RepID=UPI00053B74E8|nr:RuvA C-terminal domain-containing protein [Bacillus andreraoultii]
MLRNESQWSNYACLGYVISALKKLGYDDEHIRQLVRAIYSEFDMKSVPDAEDIFRESDY